MRKTPIFLWMIISFFTLSTAANAKAPGSLPDSLTLFQFFAQLGEDPLELTVRTDLRQLVNKKFNEEYLPAELSFTDQNGQAVKWNAELRTRGNARRSICFYPPFRLKLKKASLRGVGIKGEFNGLKMVNQCKDGDFYKQLLLREYLTYKLLNITSPISYRVKFMHITYIDTGKKEKPVDLYAFMIEDQEELAQRLGGVAIEREKFSTGMIEHGPMMEASLFQYMIGNTDWAVGNLHNLDLIKVPAYEKVVPVPYDFDYSGLVNAPYAIPAEELTIKSVLQRLYRGPACTDEAEAAALINRYLSLEKDIMECCEKFSMLDEKVRKEMMNYLEDFFSELKNPKALTNRLLKPN